MFHQPTSKNLRKRVPINWVKQRLCFIFIKFNEPRPFQPEVCTTWNYGVAEDISEVSPSFLFTLNLISSQQATEISWRPHSFFKSPPPTSPIHEWKAHQSQAKCSEQQRNGFRMSGSACSAQLAGTQRLPLVTGRGNREGREVAEKQPSQQCCLHLLYL